MMTKAACNRALASLAVMLLGEASANAVAINYIGPVGGNFADTSNWDGGFPASDEEAHLNSSANLSSAIPNDYRALRVGTVRTGVLNVSAGADMSVTTDAAWDSHVGGGAGTSGTVNQSGGTIAINYLEVGRGGTGLYSLTGGDLTISRGKSGNSLYLGTDDTKNVKNGTGTIEISGGSLRTRTGVHLGSANGTGVGTFAILGNGASLIGIGSHLDIDGAWTQNPGSTLMVGVGLGGLTKILIDETDGTAQTVTFEQGSLLDVGYHGNGYGGGTWTVMELQNGDITDHGLTFSAGVDTSVWSFAIDNSGDNGLLTVTASGPIPPPQVDVTLTVGEVKRQILKYGLDYERLWFWYGSTANKNLAAEWSVVDCDVDYIRCAINCGYELNEGVYDLSAYTSKIIPMMTTMQNANPNIKWFASPRPLNEAESGADWQPYPRWVTGQAANGQSFDFQWDKCAEFLLRYLILMDSYGFKITYLDITNEWQTNYGGRVTPPDVVNIRNYLIANLPAHMEMPLIIAPSAWSFSQGKSWINSANSQGKLDGFDLAACHNTGKQGTPQDFADAANALGKEVWDSEVHGWKGSTPTDEIPNSFQMFDRIRAGFTGLDSWLTIGTTAQGHCYLLNNGTTITRNVKYYIFQKLTSTSNFGRAVDINQPSEFTSTAALVRENLLTVWVLNTSGSDEYTEFDLGNRGISNASIARTRWNESLALEGVGDTIAATSTDVFHAEIEANSLSCFEVELEPTGWDFPFLEAENYTSMSGISVQPCADAGGGEMVAFLDASDEVSFDVDVTRRGNYNVGFRVASATANITLELFDGPHAVARLTRMATGDSQNWTTIYRTIVLDTGPTTLTVKAAGGGWNLNWMECSAVFVPPAPENIALNQAASASNVHSAGYEAAQAVDGNTSTRWATSARPAWLEINFRVPTLVNKTTILDYGNRITSYEIQYYDDTWRTAYIGGDPDDGVEYGFPTVRARKFRLQTLTSSGNPSVWEFGLYYDPYYKVTAPAASIELGLNSVSLSWAGLPGSNYALQRSTKLVTEPFTTFESEIPGQEAGNTSVLAIPEDAAVYRVILE